LDSADIVCANAGSALLKIKSANADFLRGPLRVKKLT
jgi:hypothetical protein